MVLNITGKERSSIRLKILVLIVLAESNLKLGTSAQPLIALLRGWNNLQPPSSTNEHHLSLLELRNARLFKKEIFRPALAITSTSPRPINQQLQHEQQRQQVHLQQRGYNLGTGIALNLFNSRPVEVSQLPSTTSNASHEQGGASGPLRKALMSLQNPVLFGGDILIRSEGSKHREKSYIKYERSALVSPVSLWPGGIIFYELDPSIAHLAELIWRVMQQFHEETCIRFIERDNNQPDYLRIEALKGCFSYIGRIGGEQTLSLGDGCEFFGTITHELLHAVGFYHHQNRSDRDDFLEINWENIARGKENQFSKMDPQENLLLNSFDYNSIMLYGPSTFGKTLDKITMKPKRDGIVLLEVVEKPGLSVLDIDSVNKLYKCQTYQAELQQL